MGIESRGAITTVSPLLSARVEIVRCAMLMETPDWLRWWLELQPRVWLTNEGSGVQLKMCLQCVWFVELQG